MNSTLEERFGSPESASSAAGDLESVKTPANGKTYVEEQEELRREVVDAFHRPVKVKYRPDKAGNDDAEDNDREENEDEDEGEDEDFFIPRSKTKDEIEEEEDAYRRFLQREVGGEFDFDFIGDSEGAGDIKENKDEKPKDETGKKDKKEKREGKKKKNGNGNGKEKKETDDNEFLMKYFLIFLYFVIL